MNEKEKRRMDRLFLDAARNIKAENDALKKENETLLLCLELSFAVTELWAKQQGFIPSSAGSEEDLKKELSDRKDEVRALFHKLIKTSEPAFLKGLFGALHLPKEIEHFVEKYLFLGGSTADDGF